MGIFSKIGDRFATIKEIFSFLWHRKLWWLIPFVAILLFIGILLILAQSSGVAPFIYALF
jgi:hypothetical protein